MTERTQAQEQGDGGKEKGEQTASSVSAPGPFLPADPIPADAELYAGIDVGTNSVKMIVADLAAGRANSIYDRTIITRLGEGMQALGGRLSGSAMNRTLDALDELAQAARRLNVRSLAVVGTAALRDALNTNDFLNRARTRCGLEIEVIAGEEEARLSYMAVRRDPQWRSLARLRVIDIGGGSTEIIEGVPDTDAVAARISVPYGAVRLTEAFLKYDPPTITQLDQANRAVRDAFAHIDSQAARGANAALGNTASISDNTYSASDRTGGDGAEDAAPLSGAQPAVVFDPLAEYTLVGVGGTVTNLGAINQGGRETAYPLHGHVLTAEQLGDHIDLLAQRTIEQRKTISGLDPRRADIILGGAILLAQALARLNAPALHISTRGLRWGLLYDRFFVRRKGKGERKKGNTLCCGAWFACRSHFSPFPLPFLLLLL